MTNDSEWQSEQWQQYDQRERETAEFQAIIADAINRDRIREQN